MRISFCLIVIIILIVARLTPDTTAGQTSSDDVSIGTVSMGPEDLKGDKRVAVDGMATQQECDMMMDLAEIGAKPGHGGIHTYSQYEMFEGLEVIQAARLAQQGLVPVDYPDTFLALSDRARRFVHSYFGLKQELYLTYTHLVCRTAEPYSTDDRTDLSHTVHVDNCKLQYGDWSCPQLEPVFKPRHYSAILYLNGDFKGGEFFFAHKNLTAEATVKPTCGRLVAFSSGHENPHGVTAVVKGRRCVVAMWLTLDKEHDELPRQEARRLLEPLRKSGESRKDEL